MHTKARPAIIARPRHHAGAHRIELDVTLAGQQVVLGLHRRRAEAALPQRTAAPVCAVDILRMLLPDLLHQRGAALLVLWRQQQMHMVGHQAESMDRAAGALGRHMQYIEIAAIILVGEEDRLPVVAALDHMQRDIGQCEAGVA